MTSDEFSTIVCNTLKDHKGEDVLKIYVKDKTDIADYFVIASGRSMTHTRSLIEKVEEATEKIGVVPIREEGTKEGRWAVLDYGDVIVNIFNDETRVIYFLEKLWGDEKNTVKF